MCVKCFTHVNVHQHTIIFLKLTVFSHHYEVSWSNVHCADIWHSNIVGNKSKYIVFNKWIILCNKYMKIYTLLAQREKFKDIKVVIRSGRSKRTYLRWYPRKVGSYCSTIWHPLYYSCNKPGENHERGMDRIVITTNGTYPSMGICDTYLP